MRVELIGCRDYDVPFGDSAVTPSSSFVYRLNYYLYKDDVINTDIAKMYDGDPAQCKEVPSGNE